MVFGFQEEETITPNAGRKRSADDKAKKGKDDPLPRAPPTERERYRLVERGQENSENRKEKIQKFFQKWSLTS